MKKILIPLSLLLLLGLSGCDLLAGSDSTIPPPGETADDKKLPESILKDLYPERYSTATTAKLKAESTDENGSGESILDDLNKKNDVPLPPKGGQIGKPLGYKTKKIKVITYQGYYIPEKFLHLGTGTDCPKHHWHGKNGYSAYAVDETTTFMDPGGCGFGTVDQNPLIEVDEGTNKVPAEKKSVPSF